MVDRETHQHGLGVSENVSSTLTSADRHAVAYDAYQHHNWRQSETVGPLTTHGNGVRGDTPLVADMSITGGQIVYENHAQDYRLKETKVVPTLGVNPTRNPTLVTEITPNKSNNMTGGYNQPILNDQGGAYMEVSYGVTGTLRAEMGGHQPIVMTESIPNNVMSTTGGQSAYAIGNGQTAQLKMQDKVGTLNCMHDQIAIMQKLVTENKSQEACAPMTEEDLTDKT